MKTLKTTLIYLISTIVEKGLGFLLIPVYTHYLSTQDYGILTLIQAFIAVMVIFFTLSLSGAGSRYHFEINKVFYRQLHYGNIYASVIVISLVMSLVLFVCKEWIFKLMGNIPIYPYFYLAVGIGYFMVIFNLYQLKLQMEHRAIEYSINSVLKFFFGAVFSIFFVIYMQKKADGVLLGQLLGLVLIVGYVIYKLKNEIKLNLNIKLMKRNIKYSIFLVPHNLSGIAMQLMDRFFIANMLTVSQAGIYAVGGQISGILGVINTLLNRGVTPNILRAFKEDNLEYLRNIANIYIIFVVILSLFFSLFSRNIINIIAPNEYQQAYMVINILVVYFIYQMYYFMVVGVLFYVEKATKFIPLITTFSLFWNLIFNYLFIKLFGMIGAAIATSLSMIIVTYIVIFIADKYIKVGFNHLKIHFYILIALVISNAKFIFNLKFALKITILSMLITLFFFLERNNVLIKSFKRKIYEKVFN